MRIVVEADSIAAPRMSGVGHATLEILKGFDRVLASSPRKMTVVAVVPWGKKTYVAEKYGFKRIKIRTLPPGYKYVNYALTRLPSLVPVDLYFGKGVYIFPNYKNWWVPFSRSMTFVHDVVYKLMPETVHPKNLVYLQQNFPRWIHRADALLSISKQSSEELAELFPEVKDKIRTVYLGVDPAVYHPRLRGAITKSLDKYGIAKDYFLVVGNIEPRKNIDRLVDAYQAYADAHDKAAQLVIVGGDGWRNEVLLEKIKNLQEMGYDIYRPQQYVEDVDLPDLYSGARAVIHVALHEGFGLPPIQAQACGAAVIASNIPALHEILNDDGVVYVDPEKVDEIRDALSKTWPSNMHISAKSEFTWDNTVKQLMAIAGIIK